MWPYHPFWLLGWTAGTNVGICQIRPASTKWGSITLWSLIFSFLKQQNLLKYTLHALVFLQLKRHGWWKQEGSKGVWQPYSRSQSSSHFYREPHTNFRKAGSAAVLLVWDRGFSVPWAGPYQGCCKFHWDGYWFPLHFRYAPVCRQWPQQYQLQSSFYLGWDDARETLR